MPLKDQGPHATGSPVNRIPEVETSAASIPLLADVSKLDNYYQIPATPTTRLVRELLGANVEITEVHTTGGRVHVSLRNRHNGKEFVPYLAIATDKWSTCERLLTGAYPFGVKVACGILSNASGREFRLNKDGFLDVLGFKRDEINRDQCHRSSNYNRLNDTLGLLESLCLPVYKYDKKKKVKVLSGHEPFLLQTEIPATKHFSGLNYRIGGDVTGRYGWIDKRWLTEDANRHPYVVLLYPFLGWQWELGWHQHRGTFKRNVPAVLRDIGAGYDKGNYARTVHRLEDELGYMETKGYIGSLAFHRQEDRLLVSIEAPEDHPTKTLRQGREN